MNSCKQTFSYGLYSTSGLRPVVTITDCCHRVNCAYTVTIHLYGSHLVKNKQWNSQMSVKPDQQINYSFQDSNYLSI